MKKLERTIEDVVKKYDPSAVQAKSSWGRAPKGAWLFTRFGTQLYAREVVVGGRAQYTISQFVMSWRRVGSYYQSLDELDEAIENFTW